MEIISASEFAVLRIDQVVTSHRMPLIRHMLFVFECYGGFWHIEDVPGIRIGFPQSDPQSAGFVTLSHFYLPDLFGSDVVNASPDIMMKKDMAANSERMLTLLKLGIAFGMQRGEFLAALGNPPIEIVYHDPLLRTQTDRFAIGPFTVMSVTCERLGLLELDMIRTELIQGE